MSDFHYFLDEFIETILITDSLSSVHEDGNTRFELTFILKPKQKLDLLRDNMVNRNITVFEQDDLFFSSTTNNEPFLEVFRFKQEELISNDELS